jgi:hypothetical protein
MVREDFVQEKLNKYFKELGLMVHLFLGSIKKVKFNIKVVFLIMKVQEVQNFN